MSLLDPEVVYEADVLPDQVGETYRGHEGLARATKTWLEPIQEGGMVELERVVGTGDSVVSIHRARGRARYTGIELDAPYAYLWRFRDGKVVYFKALGDPQEALKAVGLKE